MHDEIKRKLEMLSRVRAFGAANSDRFPAGSRGNQLFAELEAIVDKLQQLAGNQASNRTTGRNATVSKIAARGALIDEMEAINLNARALGVRTPGLEDKFRMPRAANDQAILASARAFAADALPLKDQFIGLDMAADFLDRLQADIAALEAALSRRRSTKNSLVNSTAAMEAVLIAGLELVQELSAVVHNRVAEDDGLMAAWLRASRAERRHRSTSAPANAPSAPDQTAAGQDKGPEPAGKSGPEQAPKADA